MLVGMSSNIKDFIIHTIGLYKVNIFNANTKKLINVENVITSFNYTKLSLDSESLKFHQKLQIFYRVFLCIKSPYDIILKIFHGTLRNIETSCYTHIATIKSSHFLDALYMILIYQYKLGIDSSHLINQHNKNTLVITSIPSIRGFSGRARVRNILNNKESSYE
ncbi:hypothetical protein [Ehrlichia sp. Wisconsin_h]|nr:hypothetical protein [Ehrlichia sp. Wisconsin_h]